MMRIANPTGDAATLNFNLIRGCQGCPTYQVVAFLSRPLFRAGVDSEDDAHDAVDVDETLLFLAKGLLPKGGQTGGGEGEYLKLSPVAGYG